MANASRDENGVPALLGALNTDGITTIRVGASASTHSLSVDDNTTGTDMGVPNAPRDQNSVPVLMAVSSVDGVTPVVVYATSDGKLFIDSN